MKCCILLHFILVLAVCQSTPLWVSSVQWVKRSLNFISEGKIEGQILVLGHYESEYNWEDENEAKVLEIFVVQDVLKGVFGCKCNLCMIINAFKIGYRGQKFYSSVRN